jgi:uncharacterized membrane protein YdcZ (DUF606 family)
MTTRAAALPATRSTRALAACLGAISGVLLVCQNGINTNLRHAALGEAPFVTACVSFSVGLAAISAVALAHGRLAGVRSDWSFRGAPWYAYMGGVIGPVYVVVSLLLTEQLGYATFQVRAAWAVPCSVRLLRKRPRTLCRSHAVRHPPLVSEGRPPVGRPPVRECARRPPAA